MCTNKRKLKGSESISLGINVSALIGKFVPQIPEKCKDPGILGIPCIIGNSKFDNAMQDLGASVSVMPMSIFNSLSLGPLQSTNVVIHLANVEAKLHGESRVIQRCFDDNNNDNKR